MSTPQIHAVVAAAVDAPELTPAAFEALLGAPLLLEEKRPARESYKGVAASGPFEAVRLDVRPLARTAALTLSARKPDPPNRAQLGLERYGNPTIDVSSPPPAGSGRVVPGTYTYRYEVRGARVGFTFERGTDRLDHVVVSRTWGERT